MQKLNGVAGKAAGGIAEYALSGETSFNILTAVDLGLYALDENPQAETGGGFWSNFKSNLFGRHANKTDTGLFELKLSRDEGITGKAFSRGGTMLGVRELAGAAQGLHDQTKVLGAKASALFGDKRGLTTLNAVNGLSCLANEFSRTLANEIWNDKLKVTYAALKDDNGLYEQETDYITVSDEYLGSTKEDAAKMAAIMAHEGTHYHGNRYESLAHMQGIGTYSAISQLYEIGMDRDFTDGIKDAILAPESWKKNEGETDHWKMSWQGQLKSDGDGWLRDENGFYINADGTHTKERQKNTLGAEKQESGLLNILHGSSGALYATFSDEDKAIAQSLMADAGLAMDKNGQWNTRLGKKIDMAALMNIAGADIASPLFEAYYNNTVDTTLAKAWRIDLGFEKNKLVPDALQEKYSNLITQHLKETKSPAALYNKYHFYVYDKNGIATTFFKIDENNPFLDDLLGQHDFKCTNSIIDKAGCNFMAQIAIPQLLKGNVFSAEIIQSLWNQSIASNYVIGGTGSSAGSVMNPDGIAKYSFPTAQLFNYGMSVGRSAWWDIMDYTSFANIMNVKNHFVLGSLYNSVIYNPGYHVSIPAVSNYEVMLYAK